MSISGVSSTSVIPQTASQNSGNLLRQTFKELASSLQSGDLAGAQKALSAVESPLQSNQFTSRSPAIESISTRKSTIQNDVAAVGKALNFGDLSAAQSN